MPWTTWPPLSEDGATDAFSDSTAPRPADVVGGSNWKVLALGVFVLAGVAGKSSRPVAD